MQFKAHGEGRGDQRGGNYNKRKGFRLQRRKNRYKED